MRFFSYKDPEQHTREQNPKVRSILDRQEVSVRGIRLDMGSGLLDEVKSYTKESVT